jgi:hypothetical protein
LLGVSVAAALNVIHSPRSTTFLWSSAAILAGTGIATMEWWSRRLVGILAVGAMNAFTSTLSGHALNHPNVPINRATAGLLAVEFGLAAFFAMALSNRPLSIADRVACVGILASFVVVFTPSVDWIGPTGLLVWTIVAWSVTLVPFHDRSR